MKILFSASECVPFIKTGGLADVVGSLASALAEQGHDVRVIIPKYSAIPDEYERRMAHTVDFEVTLGWRKQYCGIEELEKGGVTYYFLDNRYYFGRNYVYGLGGDEHERFAFFCRGVLNALPLIPFTPDVIHAHDWQTGMIPALLRIQYAGVRNFDHIKTVFTIHNLQYQGIFGIKDVQDLLGLKDADFTNDKLEFFGNANFLKSGIVYADEVTTVSPSYAEEIQTTYFGERLDGLLRSKRAHVTGILNGLDVREFDPARDGHIARTYTASDLAGKAACKRALQEELELAVSPDTPIIAMVGRLSSQKGLDLVDYVIADIMREDLQLVCLGMGESRYVNLFSWAEQNYPGRVAARFVMDNALAHRIYAGADMFLMPSAFEPCGLSQMIALRYGAVPIVRETGGLRDTVLSYNKFEGVGNGFSFFNYNAHDMLHVIQRALRYFHEEKDTWARLMERGMRADYSWVQSSRRYLELYRSLLPQLLGDGNGQAHGAWDAPPAVSAPLESAMASTPPPEKAVEAPAKKPGGRKKKEDVPRPQAELTKPRMPTAREPAKPKAKKEKETAPTSREPKSAASTEALEPQEPKNAVPAAKRTRKPKA